MPTDHTPPKRTLRIALLLNDKPLPSVQKAFNYPTYHPVFVKHLQDALASYPDQEIAGRTELVVDGFDVVEKGEYPERRLLEKGAEGGYDAIMMTGSAHSAHDTSLPWLRTLIAFIKDLATSPTTRHLKIIGICFGMQVIAMALTPPNNSPSNLDSNGKPLPPCHPNPKGWEIGVYKLTLTDAGKDWIERSKVDEEHARENGYNWDKGEGVLKLEGDVVEDSEVLEEDTIRRNTIHMQQMHKDYVPHPPPHFEILASTPKTPVQGFISYYTSPNEYTETVINEDDDGRGMHGESAEAARRVADPEVGERVQVDEEGRDGEGRRYRKKIRIVGVQGHPEFTEEIVTKMIDYREEHKLIDEETIKEARKRAGARAGGRGGGWWGGGF